MIDLVELTDGGQPAEDVATRLAAFLDQAERSLDAALYDLDLGPATAPIIQRAITAAVERGVAIRVAYNEDHRQSIPVPPPPRRPGVAEAELGLTSLAIPGVPDLMHHKYVVLDGARVWTGSTNWTDESWTREENVIAVVDSPRVAAAYARNFEELWTRRRVQGTGGWKAEEALEGSTRVRPWFSPGRGRTMAHRIAGAIGRAVRRVRICSPVLTAGPILGTLAEVAAGGRVDVAGCLDATQMYQVRNQWRSNPRSGWKLPLIAALLERAPFSGKVSTPWSAVSVHDYMHAKVTVCDDALFVGSYNLSHAGELNAENVLEIVDPTLAERMAAFIDGVRARYPALPAEPFFRH